MGHVLTHSFRGPFEEIVRSETFIVLKFRCALVTFNMKQHFDDNKINTFHFVLRNPSQAINVRAFGHSGMEPGTRPSSSESEGESSGE